MLPSEHYRQPEAGAVLTALHEITARCGYLPEDEVRKAANDLGVPLAQMFSAATFYAAFSFKPCGRHKIQVCEGTACYVKGATALMSRLAGRAGHRAGRDDGRPGLYTQACALRWLVRVDDETFGRLTPVGACPLRQWLPGRSGHPHLVFAHRPGAIRASPRGASPHQPLCPDLQPRVPGVLRDSLPPGRA
jgi:NADH:ubiquinone oxidoreductase subunit E